MLPCQRLLAPPPTLVFLCRCCGEYQKPDAERRSIPPPVIAVAVSVHRDFEYFMAATEAEPWNGCHHFGLAATLQRHAARLEANARATVDAAAKAGPLTARQATVTAEAEGTLTPRRKARRVVTRTAKAWRRALRRGSDLTWGSPTFAAALARAGPPLHFLGGEVVLRPVFAAVPRGVPVIERELTEAGARGSTAAELRACVSAPGAKAASALDFSKDRWDSSSSSSRDLAGQPGLLLLNAVHDLLGLEPGG